MRAALGNAWRRVDPLLAVVLAMATVARGLQLSTPRRLYFDEFYAQDACVYLGLADAICGSSFEATWMQPPLGKWLISTGIAVLGFEPVAWRVASVVAGILLVAFVYLLTRRLIRATFAAVLAGGLVALDPLAIVTSRIAMLDVFAASAGVASVLFAVVDRDELVRHPGGDRFLRPWRIAAGAAAGVAIAAKWSGVMVALVVVALVIAWEVSAPGARRRSWMSGVRRAASSVVAWLIVLPAGIYVASYAGRLDGAVLAVPWQDGSWISAFVERQGRMLEFHAELGQHHPYSSPAWSWLLAKRPVAFLIETDGTTRVREIVALVDPIIWVPAAVAALAALAAVVRRRSVWGPEFVIAAGVGGTYLPWLVLGESRSQVFAYYLLPTIPFLAVALAWAAKTLRPTLGKGLATGAAVISLGVLLIWAPLIYGWSLPYEAWRARMVFVDCAETGAPYSRPLPRRDLGPPPTGWCWI